MFTNLNKTEIIGKALSSDEKITATNFSFKANLLQQRDKIVYTFDVENRGKIDAELNAINLKREEVAKQNNIVYTFTYLDGSEIKAGSLLKSGESKSLKLIVEYEDVSSINNRDIEFELGISLVYIQSREENNSGEVITDYNLAINGNLEYHSNMYFPYFTY